MSANRRSILVLALLALGASLFFATFKYVGHEGIVSTSPRSGTLFRPIMSPTKSLDMDGPTFVDDAELDVGGLGLIWAGIGALALVAVAFSGTPPTATKRCPECAETRACERRFDQ